MNPINALRDMRTISQLLGDAERIAREMGEEQPSAEHLLISAVRLRDGSAARILGRFGVDGDRLRAAIGDEHASALAAAGVDADVARRVTAPDPLHPPVGRGLYRASASADEAFKSAGTLARAARQRLSGAHVVAAVAEMEHGTVARVLARLGVDRGALAAAAADELRASA